MAAHVMPMSQTIIYPPGCRERALRPDGRAGRILRDAGIHVAAVADLQAPYRVERSGAPMHVVLVTVAGRARCGGVAGDRELRAGDVWIGPARSAYAYAAVGSWTLCWFHLADRPRWRALTAGRIVPWGAGCARRLRDAMEGYLEEGLRGDAAMILDAYATLVVVLLDAAVGDASRDAGERARMQQVWERVDADLGRPWTVAELAALLAVSPVHLHRLVRRQHGCTPQQMLTRLRMRRAQALLATGDHKLATVAQAVGYATPFAFSRAFKRHVGVSPSAYRAGVE